MSFIKLGDVIVDLAGVSVIRLAQPSYKISGQTFVRLKIRGLEDDFIDLDAETSEKFRWFLKVSSSNLGILDVDKAWEQRDAIEAQIAALQTAHEATRQQPDPNQDNYKTNTGKVLTMPAQSQQASAKICKSCNGQGRLSNFNDLKSTVPFIPCPHCEGSGYVS